jgi:NADPH:quinone reductase-like Zn-dependent oxidoreductase
VTKARTVSANLEEVARPTPKDGEVLIRVRASSVTSGDARMRSFTGAGIFWLPMRLLFGVLRPCNPITGMEFAGTIAAVGQSATGFRVGDAVFGMKIDGANAEFLAGREAGAIAAKPDGLTFEEAAVVPFGALSALKFLRDFAQIRPGQKILIHGASGAVGVFAVQLAKHFGTHVTGVCSAANLELVTSFGADPRSDCL